MSKPAPRWRNRIVSHDNVPPDQLLANPANWRIHPQPQQDALSGVIAEVGYVSPVLVQAGTDTVIDGHLRVRLALRDNEPTIPVTYVDVSDAEAALILATLDPLAAMAGTDAAQLAALLAEVRTDEAATQALLDALAKDNGIEIEAGGGLTDPDDVPEPPAEPVTKPGDLWRCGNHFVLCGDATNPQHVDRLLAGNRPTLVVTDPPYGVEYDADWRNGAADKGLISHAARRVGKVANDDRVDWREAFALVPADVVYCWHASWYTSEVQQTLRATGYETRASIIWAKPTFAISRGHYHWQHEPCWYAVRQGATAHWIGDHSQTTLWEITLDKNVEGGHSTQKPVECMARPLRNHAGDVYDPFLGSGTTLIAAEQLGRTCYGMEIDARWADVAVRRWETFTGQTAEIVRPEETP